MFFALFESCDACKAGLMILSVDKKIWCCLLLLLTVSVAESKKVRLVAGESDGEGYLEIKVRQQWLSVCAGNRGLIQSACRWDGYTTGREIRKKGDPQDNKNYWSFNVTCPNDARDFSRCKVGMCVESRRMYLKCSGYPHCRMEDGTLIPGNSSLFVGNNKVGFLL